MYKNKVSKRQFSIRILLYEALGFLLMLVFIWLEELLDLPYMLFGSPPSPSNIVEAIMDSTMLITLCGLVLWMTYAQLKQIRYLEGFLHVCAFCKKIKVGNEWIPIESYITSNSEALFSHSFCPECSTKHYGDFSSCATIDKSKIA